jgi:hypothetical protein
MALALASEQLATGVSLWRVYASEAERAARAAYIGTFVLVSGPGGWVGKGLLVQRPHRFGMQEVRELAAQVAQQLHAPVITIERHGRWIRVNLVDLSVTYEEEPCGCAGTGTDGCEGGGGAAVRACDDVRLEQPWGEPVSGIAGLSRAELLRDPDLASACAGL